MKKSLETSSDSSKKVSVIPSTNEIFKLNPDCLAEVFMYLPLKHVVKILQIDERFRPAAHIRFCYGGVDQIDKEFLNDFPPDIREDFYKVYGPRAPILKVKCLAESDFINAIRHFQNLTKLVLREVSISGEGSDNIELPRSLEGLEIDQCDIPEQALRQWFVQIGATLRTLKISIRNEEQSKFNCVQELSNLSKINIDGVLPEVALGTLIEQNKNHLQSLSLGSDVTKPNYGTDTWKNISKLQHLNELTLWNYEMPGLEQQPSRPSLWPELQSLTLAMENPSTIIAHLGCQHSLKKLHLYNMNDPYATINLRPLIGFPNLRFLDMSDRNWVEGWAWPPQLSILQQVHYLILDGGAFRKTESIVRMAQEMPNLKDLFLREIFFLCGYEQDVDDMQRRLRKLKTLNVWLSVDDARTNWDYSPFD